MNLPEFSVKYPVTVAMIMTAIAILGYISVEKLGTDLLPAIYNPRVVVELKSGERAPQEMEQRFSRRLEGELGTVSKVQDVRSVCSLGRVITTVTFNWGTNMDFALLDVQKKVARFESDPEVDRVTIAKYDPQEEPIAIYALYGTKARDLDELRRIGENVIKPNLERLEGIARVEVYGGLKREVRVEVNDYLLKAFNLTASTVASKIKAANANASGGNLVEDNTSYLIKGIGKFTSIEEVAATVIGYKSAARNAAGDSSSAGQMETGTRFSEEKVPIYLHEVAAVSYAPEEKTEVVRYNMKECVGLYIYKEARSNTVNIAEEVTSTMGRMDAELAGLSFSEVYGQANFISSAIGEVKMTAVIGIVLAVLILFLFLRNIGITSIIALAIPISILATFTLMFFQDFTLNIMTLGGLALGAGMLVDNAIVVIENIFRRRQTGESAIDAAVKGTNEVGVAIIASTLTTIIVFLPIVYVKGVAAELFREQAWVVAFSLISSLLVAFLLIPTLAARVLSNKQQKINEQTLNLPLYNRLLGLAMRNQKSTVIIAVLMVLSAGFLLPVVGTEFVPRSSENQIQLDFNLPPGTPLERSHNTIKGAEGQLSQILGTAMKDGFGTINVSSAQDLLTSSSQKGEHKASITINLATGKDALSPSQAVALLQKNLVIPNAELELRVRETSLQQTIGTSGPPVIIELRGNDFTILKRLTEEIAAGCAEIETLNTIETSFETGRPEVNLQIDRLLAASFGLDVQSIGASIKERLTGEVATNFYAEGEDRNIRILFNKATMAELQNMPVTTADGATLRLRDLATFEIGEGPREIQRHNQSRVAHVTAGLNKNVPLSDAIAEVEKVTSRVHLPDGYELRFSGEEEERQHSFDQLKFALLLSIVLVYMVLASLFESLLHPFTILLTLPLAGVGVVYAFLFAGEPLSIMAYIGVIMLAGIAANDSIVLVDYINRLRRRGMARRDAIIEAARHRLRPIMMTSATTILALLPLTIGFGEGARLRAPMAIAVIGGLVTSTILTLIVIPVVYNLIDRLRKQPR